MTTSRGLTTAKAHPDGARRRRLPTVLGVLAGLAAGALLLAGCGIPTESAARPISPGLLPPAPTTTSTTATGYLPVAVYLVQSQSELVVPRTRFVKPPASLTAVVDALLAGPSQKELGTGIDTALDSTVKLLSSHVTSGLATLNFSASFGNISGTLQVLAVAQVVFTVAAEVGPTVGVAFDIEGFPIEVPSSTGKLNAGPVHTTQYASLLSTAPVATTTTTPP